MRPAETSSTEPTRDQRSATTFDSLRTAVERPQPVFTEPRVQQGSSDKPSDTAVAMRLAGEAVATAARSAETELRRLRELLDQAEVRVRAAEERARYAEKQKVEVEKLLGEIRDQILGKYPHQRAA
jgi:elongation factor P--beta-lysine ligase